MRDGLLARAPAAAIFELAEARRPGEGEHIEVEITGCAAAAILRLRRSAERRKTEQRQR
jgi:hypothetical protein